MLDDPYSSDEAPADRTRNAPQLDEECSMSKPLDPKPWADYSGSSRYRDNPDRDPFVFFEPRDGYSVLFNEYPDTATWYRT